MSITDITSDSHTDFVGRIAVYIAGDHNIFFPAVVAIKSIQVHNPNHPFDFFISFSREHLSGRMQQILSDIGATFVDVNTLKAYGSVDGMSLMRENRWPEEIFFNWVAPYHFAALGYEYALKVDYDILCVGEYQMSRLVNPASTFSALTWDLSLFREGLTDRHLSALAMPDLDATSVPYFNAGFVAINLKGYVELDLYRHFKRIYTAIESVEGSVNMTEQVALAITATVDPTPVAHLDESYNKRITSLPRLGPDKKPEIRNIHYITQNKPWKPVDFRYLDGYTKAQKTCLYMYRNTWLNFAATIPGFTDFVDIKPPTELETLSMYTEIFASHYRMEREAVSAQRAMA